MSQAWDQQTFDLLAREREVRIVTTRPDDSTVNTIIWVVVDGADAFVRSWRGERAHWYQAAIDRPEEVELIVRRRRIPVRVVSATDDESLARCSSALAAKYAGDPATKSMLRAEILGTTLRLEPRSVSTACSRVSLIIAPAECGCRRRGQAVPKVTSGRRGGHR